VTIRQFIAFATLASLAALAPLADSAAPVLSVLESRRQNLVLQQFDLSCGAAALATVLRYQHGESLSERDVAIGLISRDIYIADPNVLRNRRGFSLLDMNRYTRSLGYDGEALGRMAYNDLLDLAPAIVPVRLNGYNHFVVFRGALGDTVLLGDPAFGNRTMSRLRFSEAWIDYADLGHVAFTVRRRDGLIPPDLLTARAEDFPLLD
jgi:predicted double-glycine peptidase